MAQPQPEAVPSHLAEMPSRVPERLAALRNFFAKAEQRLPATVALTYDKLFEAAPEVASLFNGHLREQQQAFLCKLQGIVKLTRSSQLWPVGTPTGQILIPEVAEFGRRHARTGVTPEHFALMKEMMARACKETAPAEFTPAAEEALAFIFDVLAQSLTAGDSAPDALSKLRLHRNGTALHDPFAYFDEEMSAATA